MPKIYPSEAAASAAALALNERLVLAVQELLAKEPQVHPAPEQWPTWPWFRAVLRVDKKTRRAQHLVVLVVLQGTEYVEPERGFAMAKVARQVREKLDYLGKEAHEHREHGKRMVIQEVLMESLHEGLAPIGDNYDASIACVKPDGTFGVRVRLDNVPQGALNELTGLLLDFARRHGLAPHPHEPG